MLARVDITVEWLLLFDVCVTSPLDPSTQIYLASCFTAHIQSWEWDARHTHCVAPSSENFN